MEISTLGRNDAYPLENFKRGVKVWIKDPERVWIAGELVDNLSFTSTLIQILVNNGTETTLHQYDIEKSGLPFLCNPDILLGKDDLTSLSYLHEPAVLNNLRHRFEVRENIYTYCGIVLVAINPYADCAHLYGEDVIAVYQGIGKQVRSLDPHIYAIAEEAYFDLCEFGKNQSVIISGESGAGKTVSAKFVMKYLANVAATKSNNLNNRRISSLAGSGDSNAKIEDRVLASNPIMEAIGNAKTVRNDNSSRFGKFIQINFSDNFSVSGAEMKTYLLEKSRVVFQSKCERNFHIFYQMCSSPRHPVLKDLNLFSADHFLYTNAEVLDISKQKQHDIFRVLAGVLFLGNVVFEANGDKTSVQSSCSEFIQHLCHSLLEIDQNYLETWLTAREIRAGGEVMRKNLSRQEAKNNKDAIAKIIYTCLFQWIVEKINENLMHSQEAKVKRGQLAEAKFIGVLDIYGFETFETNSFEQFCINYANEKLQQQFNQHVFKLEQLEYDKEGISWIHIDFYDNQPCIDLIESNPGIIVYLDEQSKTGRGTDIEWLNQMSNCKVLKQSEHFQVPKIRDSSFTVKHFSSPVKYNINGFIEKNKDTANEQLLDTFAKTKFKFLKEILGDVLASSSTGARRKKTVAVQFRDSLKELINILSSTRPHYIRCIKPNDEKESFYFEPKRAIQQLRACGVLETVRISAAGFPSRWTYENFSKRYRILYPEASCKTKIFFRTGQVALMERIRHDVLCSSALKIQCLWRGFVARKRFQVMLRAVALIQASTRAFLAYRRIKYMQMHRAAVIIQSQSRGYFMRNKYLLLRSAILTIQSNYRSFVVRQKIMEVKRQRSVIIIQKYTKAWLARKKYGNFIQRVIKLQCCVRRWLARKRLKQLKIEAKSVNHLQKLNSGLENKIISLQHKVDHLTNERNALTIKCRDTERIQLELKNLRSNIFGPLKSLYAKKNDLKLTLGNLKNDVLSHMKHVESTNSNKTDLLNIVTEVLNKSKAKLTQKDQEISSLKTELADKNEEQQKLVEKIHVENQYAKEVEKNLEQMRAQLVQNANLLVSQNYYRKEKRSKLDLRTLDLRTNSIQGQNIGGPDSIKRYSIRGQQEDSKISSCSA
uniref:Myosin motor domain-containing protein n=1 Tax=Ditylenchus dipsaci TaxID=166011 RepID=A0A915EJG7_9BILA